MSLVHVGALLANIVADPAEAMFQSTLPVWGATFLPKSLFTI